MGTIQFCPIYMACVHTALENHQNGPCQYISRCSTVQSDVVELQLLLVEVHNAIEIGERYHGPSTSLSGVGQRTAEI